MLVMVAAAVAASRSPHKSAAQAASAAAGAPPAAGAAGAVEPPAGGVGLSSMRRRQAAANLRAATKDALAALELRQRADAYVVHSFDDDAMHRALALCAWAEAFEAKHGRPPTVWLNQLCADMSLSTVQLLAHLPVYQAKCHRLLLLAGPTLAERLWCVMECYVWSAMGGRPDDVEVEIAAANARACRDIVAGFDAFHVMHAVGTSPVVTERIEHAVKLATVPNFNIKVRDFLPLVHEAEQRFNRRGHSARMASVREASSFGNGGGAASAANSPAEPGHDDARPPPPSGGARSVRDLFKLMRGSFSEPSILTVVAAAEGSPMETPLDTPASAPLSPEGPPAAGEDVSGPTCSTE
jgi:hypothetical protein